MKNLRLLLVVAVVAGFVSMMGCTKNNNTTVTKTDSVFYSPWLKVAMQLDQADSFYEESITAASVTSATINKGLVFGYLGYQSSSGDTVIQNASELCQQLLTPGTIFLASPYPYDLSYTNTNTGGYLYRYIIVPGTVAVTSSIKNYDMKTLKSMTIDQIKQAIATPAKSTN